MVSLLEKQMRAATSCERSHPTGMFNFSRLAANQAQIFAKDRSPRDNRRTGAAPAIDAVTISQRKGLAFQLIPSPAAETSTGQLHVASYVSLSFKLSASATHIENFLCVGNETKLLKQHQRSHQHPIFSNFSARDTMNRDYRDAHFSASRADSHPHTRMRAAHRVMAHHSVARGNHLFQNQLKVRESRQPCSGLSFD